MESRNRIRGNWKSVWMLKGPSMSVSLPDATLYKHDHLHGFVVTDVTALPDMRMVAYQLTHHRSGAHLLHLHSDDQENLFAVAFRTPPPDSTGLPHILEHTVLCGSTRYPVKDPFVELLKTSLATFLNAMTYPDKTVYPCASMNEKDFFNIADVYCDAVFHPLITEMHFKQEGYHFDFAEPGNPASPLTIKGIVYNEMKGAYSDLDAIIERKTRLSICPDNAYGLDSGGDPDAFPMLTYEQFVRFYTMYYHPSNSLIFIFGNIPTEKHLAFLDQHYLSQCDRISVNASIATQPRWSAPRQEFVAYPIGPAEDTARKTAVALTFLTNPVTDSIRSLSMRLLDYYLLGNAASPLRKALIDSKLGEELTDSGYSMDQRDTYFTVGLKGTEADRTDLIVDLIKTTCEGLVRSGLEKEKVEAAFHRLELSSREIRPMYPLQLMSRVYSTWPYGTDPVHALRVNEHLAALRARYESEPGFFERQLAEMIVDNHHYSIITFSPDRGYAARKEEQFVKEMERRAARMSSQERKAIAREAAELEAMQMRPNSAEALATLPRLSLGDVAPCPIELPTTVEEIAGRPLLHTDVFSNSISYLALAFDLRGMDDDLVDYLPLYAEALRKMGAAGLSYEAMAEREAALTGGVETGVSASGHVDDCYRVQPFLVVSAKALDTRVSDMLGIVSDRILLCDFTDHNRLKDVVLQGRVHRYSEIIPRGNHFAALYAARHLSRNCALAERLGGVTQLRVYNRLARDFDTCHGAVMEKLTRIREFLLSRGRVTASFVGSTPQRTVLDAWLSEFLGRLKREMPGEERPTFHAEFETREAIATPADVSFVAAALPAVSAGHRDAPVLLLLSIYLSFGYLWNEVRVRRGAYGARAGYDASNGLFVFASYRDPCIKETLDTFGRSFHHIEQEMDLSSGAFEQAIIGTVKALDQPVRPGQAVGLALSRYLKGETPEFRRRFRTRLLALTPDDVRRAGSDLLAPSFSTAPVCVLSSRERLTAANQTLGSAALSIIDL